METISPLRYHQSFNWYIISEIMHKIIILPALMEIVKPSLMRLEWFCKQISLTEIIFARNLDRGREEDYVSVKTITHPHGYQILARPVHSWYFKNHF